MDEGEGRAVPSGRLRRMMALGGLATGIGGRVLAEGAMRLAQGERPRLPDLLLTPGNARRVTDQLAQLRGAAMKVGQLLSMDAGEMLPAELAGILARLRADADPMPPAQLRRVLDGAWGPGWLSRFRRFDVRPIASASIGQVHRAMTHDGEAVAVKVQYPGVAEAMAADLANVGLLFGGLGPVVARALAGPPVHESQPGTQGIEPAKQSAQGHRPQPHVAWPRAHHCREETDGGPPLDPGGLMPRPLPPRFRERDA
jgi:predicted unusual protein kinase regulating ubiquinone biosynthesis (AarF/ABC1/UbiB family)